MPCPSDLLGILVLFPPTLRLWLCGSFFSGGVLCWWRGGGWWWRGGGCRDCLVGPPPGRRGLRVWLTCWRLFECRSEVDASRAEKLRQEIGFTEHTWPLEKVYEYYGGSPEGGLSSAQVLQNRYVSCAIVGLRYIG